jgi:5-formyltetrahydrofolate cyclo-ligase
MLSSHKGFQLMVEAVMLTEKVLHMPAYQRAQSLAIFLSMPGREVSTRDIVLHALDQGKTVFVPYLHQGETPKSRVMDMLQLHHRDDFNSLKPDSWGIPSLPMESVGKRKNALGGTGVFNDPSNEQNSIPVLDLVFMPAVAFDPSHRRLGHGKGFYDRYLARYKSALENSQAGRSMPLLGGFFVFERFHLFRS